MTPLDTELVESLSVQLQTARFRPIGMERYGTEGAQPVAKLRLAKAPKTASTSAEPLPLAATGCRLDRMVRRGSIAEPRRGLNGA
jgi:hypothetical protein